MSSSRSLESHTIGVFHPVERFVAEIVLLCIGLAASRFPLPSGGHPFVVVTELMEKDVQKLVCSDHALGKLTEVVLALGFTGYAQTHEYLLVILVVRSINHTPRILGPGTDPDDAKVVPALGPATGVGEQDGGEIFR